MSQRWLVRVASQPQHGGGHVARCGTLAVALSAAGAEVTLQLDPDSPDARSRLQRRGLRCVEEPPGGAFDGIVLDGYELIASEAPALARLAPLVVLDDFCAPPGGTALAINGAADLVGDRIGETPALLGPRYALVDPRYAALPPRDRTAPVRNILVSMGRLDPDGATGRALDLVAAADADAALIVVAAPRDDLAGRLGARDRLVSDAPDMLPLLAEADLVIGAGGVSLLERMAAGVPSVTLVLADNQRLAVAGAARRGATLDGGRGDGAVTVTALRALLADGPARAAMAAAARQTVDGQGAARVAARLIALAAEPAPTRRTTHQGARA
jgi:spore coat polysaccharide biosynthesis predicted glycosyltransferase SpsG